MPPDEPRQSLPDQDERTYTMDEWASAWRTRAEQAEAERDRLQHKFERLTAALVGINAAMERRERASVIRKIVERALALAFDEQHPTPEEGR